MKRLREGRSKAIGFIVQTTILFAILYFFPVFGPWVGEAGIVSATVISILASAGLLFLYDLWQAPVLIDRFQREDLARAVEVARDVLDSEKRMRKLGDYYVEGKDRLSERASLDILKESYREWYAKCETYIECNFVFSKLHDFRNSGPVKVHDVFGQNNAIHPLEKDLRNRWEGKMAALNQIISLGDYSVMPHIAMQDIVSASDHQIYKYLLPGNMNTAAAKDDKH